MTMRVSREEFLGIPTQEERREVAQRMFETMMKGFDFSSYNIADNIGIDYPSDIDGCFDDEREEAWKRLIDLIEPEPERTCRNIEKDEQGYWHDFLCSKCGEAYDESDDMSYPAERIKYCPNCGAKVVN